jgi:hypothetical protein
MRLTWTEDVAGEGSATPRKMVYPRFFDPHAVVGVVAGNGPTVILLQGGHVVPVDGTVEIIWEKVRAERAVPFGAPSQEEVTEYLAEEFPLSPEALANRAKWRSQEPPDEPSDEQEGDVAMMDMRDSPMLADD